MRLWHSRGDASRVRQSPRVLSILCRGSPGPCWAKKARVRKVEERKGRLSETGQAPGWDGRPWYRDGPRKARGTAPQNPAGGWERGAGRGPACLDLCTEGRCCIPGQQEENTPEARIPVQVIATINLCGPFLFLGSFIMALETPRSGTLLPHLGIRTCPWT